MDDRSFFYDPLVGFKVKGQFSVEFFNDDPGSLLDGLCRCACGFQNLVGTSVYGGHNLPLLEGIGQKWLSKLGGDMSHFPMPTGVPALF